MGSLSKYLVSFERQTMKSDAVGTLPASIESRKIIEAFVRWSEVGKKSWNFKGSTDYLYRVQKWSDSIKPLIVNAIMHYDDTQADYFTYATAAEFLRLILNGYCKNYQNPQNFTPDMLLHKNPSVQTNNGHTKNWNDLMKMTNGADGKDARNCVLQYYNLPQGTALTSTNYEFDHIAFNKAVRKTIKTGLRFEESDLQLNDPVKKRRIFSEYLKKVLDRVDIVRCSRCRFFERCMSAYKQKGKCESYEGMEIIPSEEDGRKHFEDQYIGEFGIRFGKRIKNQNQYSQWK